MHDYIMVETTQDGEAGKTKGFSTHINAIGTFLAILSKNSGKWPIFFFYIGNAYHESKFGIERYIKYIKLA